MLSVILLNRQLILSTRKSLSAAMAVLKAGKVVSLDSMTFQLFLSNSTHIKLGTLFKQTTGTVTGCVPLRENVLFAKCSIVDIHHFIYVNMSSENKHKMKALVLSISVTSSWTVNLK